jgi:tripartite-type tricarboxylate transporter receptor subunit TctC
MSHAVKVGAGRVVRCGDHHPCERRFQGPCPSSLPLANHHDGGAVSRRRPDRHHRADSGECAPAIAWPERDHRQPRRRRRQSRHRLRRPRQSGRYTLLFTSTAIAVNPGLFANLPYDPIKDFAPISELVNAPNVLFVRPDSGINSIGDLVAKAKANPNTLNYASPGVGTKSHLTGELLKLRAGISIQHIPYRGGGPATQALVSGTVQLASVALAPVEPLIKSGTVRALAVTGSTRWYSLPDIPTMIESGFPGFVSETFNALFTPAGTPPETVSLLVKHVQEAMKRPDAIEAAKKFGYQIVAGSPEQMTARLHAEIEGVKELVAKAGIKAEN